MYKPETNEYDPYYAHYVSLVTEDDIHDAFERQPAELRAAYVGLGEAMGEYAYEPGKWTLKEMISHLIDGERIFAYRILRISRNDTTPIEGFDQDGYIEFSNANARSFDDLLGEFEACRRANEYLLRNLDEAALTRMGTASGVPVSVRALVNISIGHVRHHINVIGERYLPNANASAAS